MPPVSNYFEYFEISEKISTDSKAFFKKIKKKLPTIYDISAKRSLISPEVIPTTRKEHILHLTALLSLENAPNHKTTAHNVANLYQQHAVQSVELIKLYKIVLSYLCGEAHRAYWWRPQKYRNTNRAMRSLILMDLGVIIEEHAKACLNSRHNESLLEEETINACNKLLESATLILKNSPSHPSTSLHSEHSLKAPQKKLTNLPLNTATPPKT